MPILQVGAIPVRKTGALDISFRVFLRLVALWCIFTGLSYWARLIGLTDGGNSRFDLLLPHWQFAAASLSVLMPVAAVGLWMEVSWGAVIWVVAAGAQVIMHQFLWRWFGALPLVVGLHAAVALIYIAFRIAFLVRDRIRAGKVRSDSL